MTRSLPLMLALLVAGAALADPCRDPEGGHGKQSAPGHESLGGSRTGGDTIEDATVIPALFFADNGVTCGFTDDYDEICPYSGSTAPDVVYSYAPTADVAVDIDLCYSEYDTKVYVYQAPNYVDPIACNDDFYFGAPCYVYSSKIGGLNLLAGETYYIVIDGYGGECGEYALSVYESVPCVLECPPGALHEGEPICHEDYHDNYNGGCCGGGGGWMIIEAQGDNCATLCAKSGTYMYYGLTCRDTDWFDCVGIGETLTLDCVAEFPLQLMLIYNADCNNLQYDLANAAECEHAVLSRTVGAGIHVWPWVGPAVFNGVDCESDYILELCGIGGGPIAVEQTTWGQVKNRYRLSERRGDQ